MIMSYPISHSYIEAQSGDEELMLIVAVRCGGVMFQLITRDNQRKRRDRQDSPKGVKSPGSLQLNDPVFKSAATGALDSRRQENRFETRAQSC